jgi:hypothetical protein
MSHNNHKTTYTTQPSYTKLTIGTQQWLYLQHFIFTVTYKWAQS